jgi:hypothetical protein
MQRATKVKFLRIDQLVSLRKILCTVLYSIHRTCSCSIVTLVPNSVVFLELPIPAVELQCIQRWVSSATLLDIYFLQTVVCVWVHYDYSIHYLFYGMVWVGFVFKILTVGAQSIARLCQNLINCRRNI